MNSMFQVLVVIDTAVNGNSLQSALTRLGCIVVSTPTAEQAMDILSVQKFDAVFSELCIREQGGRAIARWIKANSPQTRFFMITSWKGELEHNLLHLDGIHGVIRKPLLFNEIRDAVLEHLG